jgi:hypothetical protein
MSEIKYSVLALIPHSRVISVGLTALLLGGCAQIQQQMQQPGYYNLPAASSTTDAVAQAEGSYATQAIRPPNQIQFDLRQPATQNPNGTAPNVVSTPVRSAKPASPVTATSTPIAAGASTKNTDGTTAQPALKPYDASGAPIDLPPADLSVTQNVEATYSAAGASIQESLIPEPQTFSGTLPCFHPEMKCSAQRITLSLAPNGRWRARAAYLDQNIQNGSVQLDQGCWRGALMDPPRITLLNTQGGVRAEMAMTSGNNLRLISLNGENPNLTYTLTRQPDLDVISELNKKPAPNCP